MRQECQTTYGVIVAVAVACLLAGCSTDAPPVQADAGDDAGSEGCVPLTCSEISESCGEVDDGCGETVTCRCPDSISVTPNPLQVKVGTTAQLTAEVKASDGTPVADPPVEWSSEDDSIAAVDQNGVVTGTSIGQTTVEVNALDVSESVDVTVTDVSVDRVEVEPTSLELALGQTAQLEARVYDAEDNELQGRAVGWSSADSAVADVDSTGEVEATGAGDTTITASVEDASADVSVAVSAEEVASVHITPEGPLVVADGESLDLTATATSTGGSETFCNVDWASNNPEVAGVDSGGTVTGHRTGIADITADCRGVTDSVRVYANDSGLSDPLLDPDDLRVWLRADAGTQLPQGNRVAAWNDLSGNEVALESASFSRRPDLISSAAGGKPVLRFYGGQDVRISSSYVELSRMTLLMVVKNNEPTHTGRIVANCLSDGGDHYVGFSGTDTGLDVFSDVGLDATISLADTTSEYQVISVVMGDSQTTIYEDGSPQSVEQVSPSGTFQFQQVGGECNAVELEGDVAEIMIYDRALSGDGRDEVEQYMMSRYGLGPS